MESLEREVEEIKDTAQFLKNLNQHEKTAYLIGIKMFHSGVDFGKIIGEQTKEPKHNLRAG